LLACLLALLLLLMLLRACSTTLTQLTLSHAASGQRSLISGAQRSAAA
jgi:hypothetical protein